MGILYFAALVTVGRLGEVLGGNNACQQEFRDMGRYMTNSGCTVCKDQFMRQSPNMRLPYNMYLQVVSKRLVVYVKARSGRQKYCRYCNAGMPRHPDVEISNLVA